MFEEILHLIAEPQTFDRPYSSLAGAQNLFSLLSSGAHLVCSSAGTQNLFSLLNSGAQAPL